MAKKLTYGSDTIIRSGTSSSLDIISLTNNILAITYGGTGNVYLRLADITNTTVTLGVINALGNTPFAGSLSTAVTRISDTDLVMGYMTSANPLSTRYFTKNADLTATVNSTITSIDSSATEMGLTTLSSTNFILSYVGPTNYGYVKLGTISSPNHNYGARYTYNSATTSYTAISALDSSRFILTFRDSTGNGTAMIGTVADSSTITFGSKYVFNAASTTTTSVHALSSTKAIIGFVDFSNFQHGTGIVATISGNTITYGSEYVFNPGTTGYLTVGSKDSSTQFTASYRDASNSSYGTSIIGTVDGSTISYSSEYVYRSANTTYNSESHLSETRSIYVYYDVNAAAVKLVYGDISSIGKKINALTFSKWDGVVLSKWNNI